MNGNRQTRAVHSDFTLFTRDQVRIAGTHWTFAHAKSDSDPLALGIVVAHGFTGNRQQDHVKKVVTALREFGGVLALDLRGHGESTGEGTMGMDEILDVDAAVTHARDFGYRSVATVGFFHGRIGGFASGGIGCGIARTRFGRERQRARVLELPRHPNYAGGAPPH